MCHGGGGSKYSPLATTFFSSPQTHLSPANDVQSICCEIKTLWAPTWANLTLSFASASGSLIDLFISEISPKNLTNACYFSLRNLVILTPADYSSFCFRDIAKNQKIHLCLFCPIFWGILVVGWGLENASMEGTESKFMRKNVTHYCLGRN